MEAIDLQTRTLQIHRTFATTPEKLFAAWTDPTLLARWWGPEGMTCPEVEMDVQAGGNWITTMVNAEGERYTVAGTYREITPHSRLVFTWAWQNVGTVGHETIVTLDFKPVAGGTRLSLHQALFENEEMRDNHEKGWTSSFNCLDQQTQS